MIDGERAPDGPGGRRANDATTFKAGPPAGTAASVPVRVPATLPTSNPAGSGALTTPAT